jgi:hypothetical protein
MLRAAPYPKMRCVGFKAMTARDDRLIEANHGPSADDKSSETISV